MDYDMLIIGSGPAGMTAGIYGGRATLTTAILEKQPGGQMGSTWSIENYPGTGSSISGPELNDEMRRQCAENGVVFIQESVTNIVANDNKTYTVTTSANNQYTAPTIILATGADPRMLNIPGEKEYRGVGVSYCATCDANFFRGLRVAVVGGGDTALEEALYLTNFASEVTLIHRRDQFRGSKILVRRVQESPKIKILYDTVMEEITAGNDGLVNGAIIRNVNTDQTEKIDVEGVFIFAGHIPNTDFIKDTGLFNMNEQGYVLVDSEMNAGKPGIYAAGDVIDKNIRQIVTAAADGCVAAINAARYFEEYDL